MLQFSRNKDKVDTEQYELNLRQNGFILCDKESMELQYLYDTALRDSLYVYAIDVMKCRSGYIYSELSRQVLYNYLTKVEKCPERYFQKRGVQGFSLDLKKVIEPLYANGFAKDFLDVYRDYSSCASRCSSIKSILAGLQETDLIDVNGRKLGKLPYSVNKQLNLRYNYRNFDIVSQLPKDYVENVTVEDGYFLAWGDFAQADLRVAYNLLLRNDENYKIMMETDDKYEGIAKLVMASIGMPFDPVKFKEERKLYKVYVLETLYGTRAAQTKKEDEFVRRLRSYLDTCEKYKDYVKRIMKRMELNLPVITTSYFGYEQMVPPFKRTTNEILNFALNSPIQTGTSEVMILTVNRIIERFRALGYTEDDISVYMARHDEVVFKCKKSILEDAWLFEESSEIVIDDWIPLRLDFMFGYQYKHEDKDLTNLARMNAERNKWRITKERIDGCSSAGYFPVPDTIELKCHLVSIGGKTVCSIVSNKLQSVNTYLINSTEEDVVKNAVVGRVFEITGYFPESSYQGAVIESNFIEGALYKDGRLLCFRKVSNASLYQAQCIAEHCANLYADRNNLNRVCRDRRDEMEQLKNYKQFSEVF